MTILTRMLLTLGIMALTDWYVFQSWRVVFHKKKWMHYIYWSVPIFLTLLIIIAILPIGADQNQPVLFPWILGIWVLFYVPKIFVAAFLLLEDIFRTFKYVKRLILPKKKEKVYFPGRRKFVSQLAMIIAAMPLSSIIYGIWKGKYRYQVIRKTLYFKDLPDAFDGLTVAQISDLHTGSFGNKDEVLKGIELLNEQDADLVFFTGDIVNNLASELDGWKDIYSKIQAKIGKFSTLGNHDYGDYSNWSSPEEKKKNFDRICEFHEKIGFQLMRNESIALDRGDQSVYIGGVENWGLPPFPQHGDLEKTFANVPENGFKVLLSHDPSHFDAEVVNYHKPVHLTLAGHTHGMQFGVEIPGYIKWSPVQLRYPRWAGLYLEKDRYLYVNRGFGYIGFHGRVGIWPEITVIELKKQV